MICIKKTYFLIILTFDISIFSQKRRENIMTNVFPYHYNLYKIRKKTMLLLNNSVFRFSDVVLLLSIRK